MNIATPVILGYSGLYVLPLRNNLYPGKLSMGGKHRGTDILKEDGALQILGY